MDQLIDFREFALALAGFAAISLDAVAARHTGWLPTTRPSPHRSARPLQHP